MLGDKESGGFLRTPLLTHEAQTSLASLLGNRVSRVPGGA